MKNLRLLILIFFISIIFSCKTVSRADAQVKDATSTTPAPSTKQASIQLLDFPSLDGLVMKADYYFLDFGAPIIVMCHQAGSSRGEYMEIAPKLNKMGYNCLVLDQRSGGQMNKIINQTAKRAKEQKLPTEYINAEQDIKAAVRWAKLNSPKKGIILWGSSYSASLVLKVAKEEKAVSKVISFSPGEYFGKAMSLVDNIKDLNKPVFITCAKNEIGSTKSIFKAIASENKTFFKPRTKGNHGSRALWGQFDDHQAYWKAVIKFLNN